MSYEIRNMQNKDKDEILSMMREFYSSEAVFTNGSEDIFLRDFDNCINDSPFLEGYVCLKNNTIAGYAMIAKSYSTEFGKRCIWLEDLYIKPEFRGMHLGSFILEFIENHYRNSVIRLEVEKENSCAVNIYKKHGFSFLPYAEMKKDI